MKSLLLLAVLIPFALASIVSREGEIHYHGYSVVRALIATADQFAKVESLDLDIWSNDGSLGYGPVDIMVNADARSALDAADILYDVIVKDVEEANIAQKESAPRAPLGFHDAYHTYAEIDAFLRNLTTTLPSLVQYANLGSSIGGRSIPGIRITSGSASNKKKIFFNGGQHAREWIGPATVLYIVDQLIQGFNKDTEVTRLLTSAEFYVVPLVNPDGYEYTRTTNRLWRKNRRANTGGTYGVDLNRNWNDHWGGQGSSSNPADDTYRGTGPFSEPESTVVSRFVTANGPFHGAIDYHSYSQLVLRPYGWSNTLPSNDAVAKSVGDKISADIRANGGKAYTSQASWQLYYTTGSAQDWYYGQARIPLSYTIELRDTGTYGFQLPANQIIPTGVENWAAFKNFATYIVNN